MDFNAYDEMRAGKPDAGHPHVRLDEGEQRDLRKGPVALYPTGSIFFRWLVSVGAVQERVAGHSLDSL